MAFVGKLIVSKGVDLLLAAWPLVLERVPDARLVVVGFGAYREGLERLARRAAPRRPRRGAARSPRQGRGAEGGPARPLRHARRVPRRAARARRASATSRRAGGLARAAWSFTGRLEHDELVDLLPACEALVVPSTFPEAFGMVAAEAAACGVLPISAGALRPGRGQPGARARRARQSAGLAVLPGRRDAVPALAERLVGWLEAPEPLRVAHPCGARGPPASATPGRASPAA